MCATCGCSPTESHDETVHHEHARHHHHEHEHAHHHDHDHHDRHHPAPGQEQRLRRVALEQDILAKNDAIAAENRQALAQRQIAALNVVSAPGSGKTSLLEAVIRRLSGRIDLSVIEGDQETERDADRIRAAGCSVIQINTRSGCHLDAEMVRGALAKLAPHAQSLLLIENVGNLVCPALFDLGERHKVAVLSVTEGEDKPLKYPHMFRAASVLVLTKIDLLPHLEFDVEACLSNARRVNPALIIFALSAKTGDGVTTFCDWLEAQTVSASAVGAQL